ncbi:MAG TPA: exodeoxyribonuclease VII small subunit [Anaerolineales bacterium]
MSKNKDQEIQERPPLDQLSYEEAFAELEAIVTALESDERPLEESLALFERGQALARHCTEMLDRAELKVQQLSGEQLVDFTSP